MGWLWTSNKAPPTSPSSSTQTTTSPDSLKQPPQASEQTPTSSTDAELHALLSSAQTPPASSPPLPHQQTPPSPPPSTSSSSPNEDNRITPLTTTPTTLSCRTAFDAAFHCQSFGGQFANVYRYGSLRSCSAHWGDFWFCVRTNRGLMDEERRRETVRMWAVGREREKYEGEGGMEAKGSSEDVWEKRRWKVRGAFEGDWGVLEREAREREAGERGEGEVQGHGEGR